MPLAELALSRAGARSKAAVLVAALFVGGPAATGCAGGCRDDDPDRRTAFEAAWRNDIAAMRDLMTKNAEAANTRECEPGYTLFGRLIAKQIGAGTATVLHVAARQGHAEFAALLLAARADVDARDGEANTPLHLAAQYGHDEVAKLLLAANAAVDARRLGGLTPLLVAAAHGRFPVAKLLLAAGADVNAADNGKWTALHRAASEGRDNIVRLLLDQGADPQAVDDQGAAPLQYAVLNRHRAAIELLTARGVAASGESSGPKALALAARNGDPDSVRTLLSQGVPVDVRETDGRTPLQQAINPEPGGDPDWQEARTREEREVVRMLLAAGANVEVRGRSGNRPLHLAAMYGRVDIAELLLARGADINAANESNYTPLHFAVSQVHPRMVAFLLERGANPNARNTGGHTPLADAWGSPQIQTMLKNAGARR